MEQSIQDILKQYWGYESFRDSQEEIIQSVLKKTNTLALLPTGGGKSICYQLPALAKEGICIVVSPLIALMKDQVNNLTERGIKAMVIFSGMNKREIDIALDNCVYGNYKFLYVSPERMQTEIFRERLKRMKVNLVAIDEAHCISQWGHDFRPSYKKITDIKDLLPTDTPFMAVTATANNRVIADISETLDISHSSIFKQTFERENLSYLVLHEENKETRLISILKKANSCGIVYVNTRKNASLVSDILNREGIKADFYHGGLPQLLRDKKQKSWINNQIQVMVATNAFGMGIDKSDVRVVIHMELPNTPEGYFQEAGRAGRDGKKSFAVLLYKPSDKIGLQKFHELEYPDIQEIKKVYNLLGNYYRLAIGSGEFTNHEFILSDFCHQFNLQPLSTHHSLSILTLAGYINISEAIYRPPRVKFSVNNEELYQFRVRNEKYDGIIQLILRNSEGIFDNYLKISPYSIGNSLKKTESEVEQMLSYLTSISILDYQPASDVPLLTYIQGRLHEDRLKFPKTIYRDRKRVKKGQLDFMINYCESDKVCRSKMLLSYFDETEFNDCGHCDVCLSNKKKQLSASSFEKIDLQITTHFLSSPISVKSLVNKLPEFDEKDVLKVIQWKLDSNQLMYNEYYQLISTKKEE